MRVHSILVLVALSAAACSSSGGSKVPPTPPRKDPLAVLDVEPKQPAIPPPNLGEGKAFTAAERDFMNRAFRAFMREEPTWPDDRSRWLAMGPSSGQTLVENLFVYLLAAQNAARMADARRAQGELVDLGAAAVPYLLLALRLETFADRTGKRQRVDEVTRQTAATTIALMGEPAVEPLLAALPAMPEASRRAVAANLADLVDPRVTRALLGLLDDGAYVVAAEAASSLRTHPGEDVSRRLVAALGDTKRDRLVRERAGTSLLRRADPAVVPDLIAVMEKARAADDLALLVAVGRILRRTTGQSLPNDPEEWRRALREGKLS